MTSGAPCIRFDIDRDTRIGIAEAVFCEGKPERALVTLLTRFSDPAEKPILLRGSQNPSLSASPLRTRCAKPAITTPYRAPPGLKRCP